MMTDNLQSDIKSMHLIDKNLLHSQIVPSFLHFQKFIANCIHIFIAFIVLKYINVFTDALDLQT